MKELRIGDVTISSIIERDGAWRAPAVMFPAYDVAVGQRHLQELPPFVYDKVKDLLVITYQTFVVRPHGLEYQADRRAVGAHVSQRKVHFSPA